MTRIQLAALLEEEGIDAEQALKISEAAFKASLGKSGYLEHLISHQEKVLDRLLADTEGAKKNIAILQRCVKRVRETREA